MSRVTSEPSWGGRFKREQRRQMDYQYLPTVLTSKEYTTQLQSNSLYWKYASCLKSCLPKVVNVFPPANPFSLHPLPPPSIWLSIAFLRTLSWILFNQNLATTSEKSGQWEGKERCDPLESPIQIQVCSPIFGPGKSLELGSEEKEVVAWLFSCLGHWTFDPSLFLTLRELNVFFLTLCCCKLPPPSHQYFVGLNFTRLH